MIIQNIFIRHDRSHGSSDWNSSSKLRPTRFLVSKTFVLIVARDPENASYRSASTETLM